ncbi:DUF3221 domain-containing protein [Brevibacillus sp. HB2.2]|uniref:DUF3221 domain-containing protein n=1 Tax=Brevibacillus sp. HB2.2 TaxID=2738846 RepID=UPI00156AE97E|nr:DUF3221 domain-containing protein [Brevibacillus sp. HB2.2]NRS51795.1 DUF3221 domain-containing protein [Brevibacillus sp. HB2.2]
MSTLKKALILIIASLLITGCATNHKDVEKQALTGYVTEKDFEKKALLVIENDETKTSDENLYAAEWYFPKEEAVFLDSKGNNISYDEIEVGHTVSTWSTTPSAQSYPSGAELSKLVINEESKNPINQMDEKSAIQHAINYLKSKHDDGIIIKSASGQKDYWQIKATDYDHKKETNLQIHAQTGEVKEF